MKALKVAWVDDMETGGYGCQLRVQAEQQGFKPRWLNSE